MATWNGGGSQRVTRNSMKIQRTTDDDMVTKINDDNDRMLKLDAKDADDDFELCLSQTQNTQLDTSDRSADGLHLWLSQQPPSQQSSDDIAESDVHMNVREILNMIRHNHKYMVKQNDMLFNLVRDVSVNVSDISDKICTLEKKFCVISKTVKDNKDTIVEVQNNLKKLENSVVILKKNMVKSVTSDELEVRLKAIEDKLKKQHADIQTTAVNDVMMADPSGDAIHDRQVYVKNLSFGMKDDDDVEKLIKEGMGLNISVMSLQRAPSINNMAGIVTVEMHSKDDKVKMLRSKSKLRQSMDYFNVYIEDTNSPVQMRIEQKLQMLMRNVQHASSFQYPHKSRYHSDVHNRNSTYTPTQ